MPSVAVTMAATMAATMALAVTTLANAAIECAGGDVDISAWCLWLVVAWEVLGGG